MWPFKKKPDLWRESVETRFVDLTDRCERLAIELGQRAIGTHTHPPQEHAHELPANFLEHTHPEVKGPDYPHVTGKRLEGRVTCEHCGASYDLQKDCHIGNSQDVVIICSGCLHQMRIGTHGS